jgi:hypothetical protein
MDATTPAHLPVAAAEWDSQRLAEALGGMGSGSGSGGPLWKRLGNAVVDMEVSGADLCAQAASPEQLQQYAAWQLHVELLPDQVQAILKLLRGSDDDDHDGAAVNAGGAAAASDSGDAAVGVHEDADASPSPPRAHADTTPATDAERGGSWDDDDDDKNNNNNNVVVADAADNHHHHQQQNQQHRYDSAIATKAEHEQQQEQLQRQGGNGTTSTAHQQPTTTTTTTTTARAPAVVGGGGGLLCGVAVPTAFAPAVTAAAEQTEHAEDVLQRLRARSVRFCERHPRHRDALLAMPGLFMDDKLLPFCFACDSNFTLFHRRHHCRLCGLLFCKGCCADQMRLPAVFRQGDKPVRACVLRAYCMRACVRCCSE